MNRVLLEEKVTRNKLDKREESLLVPLKKGDAVTIKYTDTATEVGEFFVSQHSQGCGGHYTNQEIFAGGTPYRQHWYGICQCTHPFNGSYATRYAEPLKWEYNPNSEWHWSAQPVLWRFVPRPLNLEDAVKFNELQWMEAAVLVDWYLENGWASLGERVAKHLHELKRRK